MQLWLSKLSLSGAVSRPAKPDVAPPPPRKEPVSKTAHKVSGSPCVCVCVCACVQWSQCRLDSTNPPLT